MSTISTHVLDTVLGKPAAEISVSLEKTSPEQVSLEQASLGQRTGAAWVPVSTGITDADGRCRDLARDVALGVYRLTFASGPYLERHGRCGIYPEISITFTCDGAAHYHLPLLLSDNSYTTYRGS